MNAEELAAAKLGKAVHPNALRRLFELWPEAAVRVQHVPMPLPEYGRMVQGQRDAWHVPHRTVTMVTIENASTFLTTGTAVCMPDDNWERRKGIKIAFDRALDAARELAA